MRISDWSSDVCSSDLARLVAQGLRLVHCDLSGLLEAEGPEDRAVPNQDLVTVPSGLEAHDGASESLAELCECDHACASSMALKNVSKSTRSISSMAVLSWSMAASAAQPLSPPWKLSGMLS